MYLLLVLSWLSHSSFAQSDACGSASAASSQVSSVMKQMVQPESMIGSCATTQWKEVTNWRDSLDAQVSQYLKSDHESELSGALDANNMTNPQVVYDQTDGYVQASERYKTLINSYPDKKGADSSQFTDVRRILAAKDMKAKERNKVEAELNGLIGTMASEQDKWPEFYLDKTKKLLDDPALKAKIADQAKDKFCVSGVDFQIYPAAGMRVELLRDSNNKPDQAIQKVLAKNKLDESREDRVWFCTKPILMRSGLHEVSGLISFDVPKDSFFADNQATLSPDKLKAFKEKLKSQLTSAPGCTRRVKSVQIETSSNAKANADSIGRWNFSKLSADRAEYLKGQVGAIFGEEGKNPRFAKLSNFESIARVSSAGSNGDGTSGPCPYELKSVNGVQKVVKKDDVWNSKVMEESKYARISFEIEDEGVTCNHGSSYEKEKPQMYAASQCYTVQISCK